jgi:hypothetical protein
MVAAPQFPASKPQAGEERKGEARKPIDEKAKERCADRGPETFPLAQKGLERGIVGAPFRALPA